MSADVADAHEFGCNVEITRITDGIGADIIVIVTGLAELTHMEEMGVLARFAQMQLPACGVSGPADGEAEQVGPHVLIELEKLGNDFLGLRVVVPVGDAFVVRHDMRADLTGFDDKDAAHGHLTGARRRCSAFPKGGRMASGQAEISTNFRMRLQTLAQRLRERAFAAGPCFDADLEHGTRPALG